MLLTQILEYFTSKSKIELVLYSYTFQFPAKHFQEVSEVYMNHVVTLWSEPLIMDLLLFEGSGSTEVAY